MQSSEDYTADRERGAFADSTHNPHHVPIQYGLDEEGIQLICDEAIATYRKLAGDDWGKDRNLYEQAHEEAIKRATRTVTEELYGENIPQ